MRTFCPHLGSFFVLFLLSLHFGQIFTSGLLQGIYRGKSPEDRGVESRRFQVSFVRRKRFQILPKPARGLLGQKQLWKAVITGDTVTRLIIPIRGRGKSPEEGQRWKFGRNVVKERTTQKNYQDEDKKVHNE